MRVRTNPDYCCRAGASRLRRRTNPPPAPPAIHEQWSPPTPQLATVTDVPLHFKGGEHHLQRTRKSGVSAPTSSFYQISGLDEGRARGEGKNATTERAVHRRRPERTRRSRAGPAEGHSTFLHFYLRPCGLGSVAEPAPADVEEYIAPQRTRFPT